ncbi:hypothetical protein TPA0598_17_00110 [Streptomyces lydicamycinicus]|uniref:Uncharacterized protein n=1 Tax=Streptomyces lydicamycinicus TaxID=1546107 RepID=A0A0P4RGX0_9ACTN|nr:hypothetical protein TPA0598_17_00110 [Streptomyces lydicamycinicus]
MVVRAPGQIRSDRLTRPTRCAGPGLVLQMAAAGGSSGGARVRFRPPEVGEVGSAVPEGSAHVAVPAAHDAKPSGAIRALPHQRTPVPAHDVHVRHVSWRTPLESKVVSVWPFWPPHAVHCGGW